MGQGQLCEVSSASVLFEPVAGLDERLGEAASADHNRRVVASRLDVEHQVRPRGWCSRLARGGAGQIAWRAARRWRRQRMGCWVTTAPTAARTANPTASPADPENPSSHHRQWRWSARSPYRSLILRRSSCWCDSLESAIPSNASLSSASRSRTVYLSGLLIGTRGSERQAQGGIVSRRQIRVTASSADVRRAWESASPEPAVSTPGRLSAYLA